MSSEGQLAEMWHFRALMPNLRLKEPVGNEVMSMVPYDDPRLREMADADGRLRVLLEGFTDQFQRQRRPSAIITQKPLPPDAMIDFRNVVAVSCILGAAQVSLLCDPPLSSIWPVEFSDHFDLYPITPVLPPGKGFFTNSYAGVGIDDDVGKFRGQTSPALFNVEQAVAAPDGTVLSLLMQQWKTAWQTGDFDARKSRRVFRSLQLAFHASTMPSRNMASLYDYGASVSHWVSAIEVLLHPDTGDVKTQCVQCALGRCVWKDRRVGKFVKDLYFRLYRLRCDFMHGNELNSKHLSPVAAENAPGWFHVAPLLFKAALRSQLASPTEPDCLLEEALSRLLDMNAAEEDSTARREGTVGE